MLIGGGGEQLTLRATAHHGDRWNIPWGDPEAYAGKLEVLREHCRAFDRDYDSIVKTVANTTVLRETTAAAHDAYERLLERFDEVGLDQFMLKVPSNDRRTVELFVDEVMGTM